MTEFFIAYPSIPQRATASLVDNGMLQSFTSLDKLVNGPRSQGFELQSGISGPATFQYDLGVSVSSAINFASIQRARTLTKAGSTTLNVVGSDYSFVQPSATLGSALKLWLRADRGVTADSSGRVSVWADQSSSGYNATQSTQANQPLISRCDNRENWLLYSEKFDTGSAWAHSGTNITADSTSNPIDRATTAEAVTEDSSTGNHRLTSSLYSGFVSGTSYRMSIYAKANGRTRFEMYFGGGAFASQGGSFNLSSVTASNLSSGVATIESAGDGWYRCTVTATASSTTTARMDCYLLNGAGSNSYTGDGASGLYMWGAQVHRAAAATTYVAAVDTRVMKGVNGRPCISFDGSDDYLSANSLSSVLTGNDTPFSLIVVIVPRNTNSRYFWSTGRSSTANPYISLAHVTTNQIQVERRDDAASGASQAAGTTTGAAQVLSVSFSGTTVSAWLDGTLIMNALALNVGTLTLDNATIGALGRNTISDYFTGEICELLVTNAAISTNDRLAIEAQLTQKWITAADQTQSTALDQATLYGPRGEDWYSVISTTSARRYWWLSVGSDKSSNRIRHSKQFMGMLFDFGREPNYSIVTEMQSKTLGEREPKFSVKLEWVGVSATAAQSFIDKIGTYKDTNGYVLYEFTDKILNGWKILHVRCVEYTAKPNNVDNWTVTASFEEMV